MTMTPPNDTQQHTGSDGEQSSTSHSPDRLNTDRFENAFAATAYEMVTVTDSLTIPTATPACFVPVTKRVASDAEAAIAALESEETVLNTRISLIAPYSVDESDGDGLYVSSKGYVSSTNEFFRVKITANRVCVFPADQSFSLETLATVIRALESHLDVELAFQSDDGGVDRDG